MELYIDFRTGPPPSDELPSWTAAGRVAEYEVLVNLWLLLGTHRMSKTISDWNDLQDTLEAAVHTVKPEARE